MSPQTRDFACTTMVADVGTPDSIERLLFVNHLLNRQLNFEREREMQALAAAGVISD